MTSEEIFRDKRGVMVVKRDDNGELVQVHHAFVRWLTTERVEILVPGHEGSGTVVHQPETN